MGGRSVYCAVTSCRLRGGQVPVLRRWPRGLLKYGGEALHLRGAGDWRRGQWDAAGRGEGKSLDWRPRRSGAQLSETRHLPRPRARRQGQGFDEGHLNVYTGGAGSKQGRARHRGQTDRCEGRKEDALVGRSRPANKTARGNREPRVQLRTGSPLFAAKASGLAVPARRGGGAAARRARTSTNRGCSIPNTP